MKNDGGPAFARPTFIHSRGCGTGYYVDGTNGMSLRDWFAGKALIGLTSSIRACTDGEDYSPEQMAEYCYECAAAMIAERSNNHGS